MGEKSSWCWLSAGNGIWELAGSLLSSQKKAGEDTLFPYMVVQMEPMDARRTWGKKGRENSIWSSGEVLLLLGLGMVWVEMVLVP